MVLTGVVVLVLCLVVTVAGFRALAQDRGRPAAAPSTAAPSDPPSSPVPSSSGVRRPVVPPTPAPTSSRPTWQPLGVDFFAWRVPSRRGEYRLYRRWTRTCLKEAKPRLAALLRREPCVSALYGALYRSPSRKVYVQMTLMRFASSADAERMAGAISDRAAPRIRAGRGSEPGHWWSASHAGRHVLIRQSFVRGARKPGTRNGPAQIYGDTLIRRFQAILAEHYANRSG